MRRERTDTTVTYRDGWERVWGPKPAPEMIRTTFPLRPGMQIQVEIPRDLRLRDLARFVSFLVTMCDDWGPDDGVPAVRFLSGKTVRRERTGAAVKSISIRQPWTWAILHAGKRIENRSWHTAYRGPILLHAAKTCTSREWQTATNWMRDTGVLNGTNLSVPWPGNLPCGGIVGRALLADMVPPCAGPGGRCQCKATLSFGRSWHDPEKYGFVLANVEPLPFVPCKGALSLFELDYP